MEVSIWTLEPYSSSKMWGFENDRLLVYLAHWQRQSRAGGMSNLCLICRFQNIWACGGWQQQHLKRLKTGSVPPERHTRGWHANLLTQCHAINEPDLIWLLWHIWKVSAVVPRWRNENTNASWNGGGWKETSTLNNCNLCSVFASKVWLIKICHTSLWSWHVDCDDLAVGGQRQFGGHYLSTHWGSCNLEGVPTRRGHCGLRACS